MFRSILIAVDLDEPSSWSRALPAGVSLAQAHDARVTLATVLTDASARRDAQWSVAAYRELVDVAEARLAGLA